MTRLILAVVFFLIMQLSAPSIAVAAFETGGTDYSVYDLSAYGENPTEGNWNTVRFVLAHYDENPTLVANQIKAMCDKGQKKIGLMLWFMPQTYDGSWADSSNGRPTTKIQNNITAVLTLIKNQKNWAGQLCFNEVQFRFAPIGVAQPQNWTSWDESLYLQNKSFIWFTRDLVRNTLSGSSISVVFDLGAEQGGQTTGKNTDYLKRLWKDYTDSFGKADTYGFSIAWFSGAFTKLIQVYDSVGKRPLQHAVDIYDVLNTGITSQISRLYDEMKTAGEKNTPLIIQETYFADQQAFDEINTMRSRGLNVRTIMQWQVTRRDFFRADGSYRHVSTTAADYIYYGSDYVFPPSNLRYICFNNGTRVTLTWDGSATAVSYPFRLDQMSNNSNACQYGWLCPNSTDIATEVYPPTSYYATIIPNQIYNWWVHTRIATGAVSDPVSQQFTCASTPKVGDLNGDGRVDIFDYNILVGDYGKTGNPGWIPSDINRDGKVDISDYNILVAEYGR